MDELNDAIDAEIQRELDAISLSSLDLEELHPNEILEQVPDERQVTTSDFPSTILFLEKSSERNKVAQGILQEAEDLLNQCNNDRISEPLSKDAENQSELMEYIISTIALKKDGRGLVSTKSSEEIEKENRIKLEELEVRFKVDTEKENLQLEQERVAGEGKMKHWMDQEEKMQRNIKVMMDKADYWERTYHQVAQTELTEKENYLEREFLESQKRILEMQEEQERILHNLLREKEELDTKKRKDAAACIQAIFRGFSIRTKFGAEVQNRITEMKQKKRQERILELETKCAEEKARKQEEEEKKQREHKEKIKREKERKKSPPAVSSSHRTFLDTTAEKGNIQRSNEIPDNALVENMIQNIKTQQLSSSDAMLKTKQMAIIETQDESEVQSVTTELTRENNRIYDANEGLVLTENSKATTGSAIGIHVDASGDTDGFDSGTRASTDGVSLENDSEIDLNHNLIKCESQVDSETTVHHAKPNLETSKKNIEIEPTVESKDELVKDDHKTKVRRQPELRDDSLDDEVAVSTANFETTVFERLDNLLTENYSSSSTISKVEINKDLEVTKETSIVPDLKNLSNENQKGSDSALPDVEPLSAVAHQGKCLDIFADNKNQKNLSQPQMEASSQIVESSQQFGNAEVESENGMAVDSQTEFVSHGMNQSSGAIHENSVAQEMELTFLTRQESENARSDIYPESTPLNLTLATVVETYQDDQTITDVSQYSNQQSDHEVSDTKTSLKFPPSQNDEANLISDGQHTNGDESNLPRDDNIEVNSQLQSNKLGHQPTNDSVAEIPPQDCTRLSQRKQNLGNCVENFTSYARKIEKQRRSWLETFLKKSKQKDTNRSPTAVRKRRRLIRMSSAAKRLEPFSQSEILNGAYDSPDCRVDKMASSTEETKCLVLYGIASCRNLTNIASCAFLTYLTVQKCGLVSLENLQSCSTLKYINVPNNSINMVSCGGMAHLEYLDFSHNWLTSIHGLEQGSATF